MVLAVTNEIRWRFLHIFKWKEHGKSAAAGKSECELRLCIKLSKYHPSNSGGV